MRPLVSLAQATPGSARFAEQIHSTTPSRACGFHLAAGSSLLPMMQRFPIKLGAGSSNADPSWKENTCEVHVPEFTVAGCQEAEHGNHRSACPDPVDLVCSPIP